MLETANSLQIAVPAGARGRQLHLELLEYAHSDQERYLDLLSASLQLAPLTLEVQMLDSSLTRGGSVWRATERGLERRVDPTAMVALDQATRLRDSASDELGEAWNRAYGRDPDASDAWDHAIKAVEAILREIISPDNHTATLGTLIRDLRDGAPKFEFVLANALGGVPTLVAMLQLMYPNPDRHSVPNHRKPTLDEAHAVVQLAMTIVQWARDGQILRK
jgi:hypothetical protein